MRCFRYLLAIAGGLVLILYMLNASWLAGSVDGDPYLVAHRGVHHTFDNTDVGREDCTAGLIGPVEHEFIENTIPSIRAALDAGASWVEFDTHPTTDGEFAVFHDWTLDCRTDGTGVVREQSMDYLRTLDVGWGYTPDGGKTYPLRGTAVGAIPSLREVLTEFPDTRFVIDFKSNNSREAEWLSDYLLAVDPDAFDRIAVIGGQGPVERFLALHPQVRGGHARAIRDCLTRYAMVGWSGVVPEVCRNRLLLIPRNYAPFLWGWPARFEQRMAAVDTKVWIMGHWGGPGHAATTLDTLEELEALPAGFSGGIWTNRIEILGPAMQRAD